MKNAVSRSAFEVLKVLVIFCAFYLLQNQIFEVRHDIYGRTSGLAQAQAYTTEEIDDTQRIIRIAAEDSASAIARAKLELDESITRLREERDQLRRVIEARTQELETELLERISGETEKLHVTSRTANENSVNLASLSGRVEKDAAQMKRRMILPTVQLRGNGTVGSGVLIYSQMQPGVGNGQVFSTFVLTACHVVQEVVGEEPEKGLDVPEIRVLGDTDADDPVTVGGQVVAYELKKDLALLRLHVTSEFDHLARLSDRESLERLDVFSQAYAVGCPLGNPPMPTLGEISSKRKVVGDQVFWMLNAPTFFGNSGGGIYQPPEFELIGVSSMIYTYGKRNPTVVPHMGLFVPLASVYNWLDDNDLGFVYKGEPVPAKRQGELVYLPQTGGLPVLTTAVDSD